jgi:hypothetical protein
MNALVSNVVQEVMKHPLACEVSVQVDAGSPAESQLLQELAPHLGSNEIYTADVDLSKALVEFDRQISASCEARNLRQVCVIRYEYYSEIPAELYIVIDQSVEAFPKWKATIAVTCVSR